MQPKDLAKVWDAPDNSKLTKKQTSIRLPILVAAKLEALCLMFPRKTKTEIIGDLLATALEQMEEGLPMTPGKPIYDENTFEACGPRATFRQNTATFLRTLEEEAGISDPLPYANTLRCDEEGNSANPDLW